MLSVTLAVTVAGQFTFGMLPHAVCVMTGFTVSDDAVNEKYEEGAPAGAVPVLLNESVVVR